MSMFGFDDKYAMFDITPVQNQFIAEYLPHAKGDYVKVWLYGLMQCYHASEDLNPDTMAHELEMTEEDVLAAFRYWERRGLVHRISDKPPQYRYVSLTQVSMAPVTDTEYEAFAEDIYCAFGKSRRLHGSEISQCYEWVEELKLPPEVVIMLLKHMVAVKGKNFTIRSAEPLAVRLAEAGAKTIEDAESVLSADRKLMDGAAKVLKRFGRRRLPSDDEIALYRKWTQEWGFSEDGIEAACGETVKGDPNFGYLDAILKKLHDRGEGKTAISAKDVEGALAETNSLRELLYVLGRGSVNSSTVGLYREMREMYPEDVILLAGRECATKGKEIEDVRSLLASWQKRGLSTEKDILDYISRFREQSKLIGELNDMWGLRGRGTAADRTMLDRWEHEYGFDRGLILSAAEYASGKAQPMAYLDALLRNCNEKGIRTREEMEADRKAHQEKNRENAGNGPENRGRKLNAQQFEQRTYTDGSDEMDAMMKQEAGTDA